MKILSITRRVGSPRYAARDLIRLTATESGALDCCTPELRAVPWGDVLLAEAFATTPGLGQVEKPRLLFVLRDQARPFSVPAAALDTAALFNTPGLDPIEALRAFGHTLEARSPEAAISQETAKFLAGGSLSVVRDTETDSLATSLLAALDPEVAKRQLTQKEAGARTREEGLIPKEEAGGDIEPKLRPDPLHPLSGPGSPYPSPPLIPPFDASLGYGNERLDTITRGLGEPLPPPVMGPRDRIAPILLPLAALLPGLLYAAAIGLLSYTAYRYAYQGIALFAIFEGGQRPLEVADFAFILPLGICLLFLLTLLEPLLVRQPPPIPPRPAKRSEEPVLFGFVERLARTLGAPMPEILQLTIDGDLGLHRHGPRRGRQLVLTLGAPLLAGLTTGQLAGLLTREFSLFTRHPGNRSLHFVRLLDDRLAQLLADCGDLQEKRRQGVGQLLSRIRLAPLVDLPLYLVFGVIHGYLSLLSQLSGIVRDLAEKQANLRATARQELLMGPRETATTLEWAETLRAAQGEIVLGFDESQLASRPPDDLAAQVVVHALELRGQPTARTQPLAEGKARYRSSLPGAALLRTPYKTSRRLTADLYRNLERPRFDLRPFEDLLEERLPWRRQAAVTLHFFGLPTGLHSTIPMAAELSADPRPLAAQRANLIELRNSLGPGLPKFYKLRRHVEQGWHHLRNARLSRDLMAFGVEDDPRFFGLDAWTREATVALERKAVGFLQKTHQALAPLETAAGRRLMSALAMLSTPENAQRILGKPELTPRINELLATLITTQRLFAKLLQFRERVLRLEALTRRSDKLPYDQRQRLTEYLAAQKAALEEPWENLRGPLLQAVDHFHIGGFDLESARRGMPNDLVAAGRDLSHRALTHHHRALAYLCTLAFEVERRAGLPPLKGQTP